MTTKQLVYTALMTAIIAILGLVPGIPLPFMPVPIILQNIGIFLAGIILGRRLGALSVIIFLLLVIAGLPLLSGGRGGIAVFAGPTVGYLVLYPFVAYFIGLVRDKYLQRVNFIVLFIAILLFGVVGLNILGTIIMGLMIHIPLSKALLLSLTFMPGDLIKAIIASLIGTAILNHSRFKQLIR